MTILRNLDRDSTIMRNITSGDVVEVFIQVF